MSDMIRPPLNVDTLPRDWETFSKLQFDLPRLPEDSEASMPKTKGDLLEYIEMESGNPDATNLKFVRTADIDDVHYWLWDNPSDDPKWSEGVYIEEYEGQLLYGLESWSGLSPEQFLVRAHLENQYDIKIVRR